MNKYGLNEIRELFLKFFETKEHLRLKSASLIPENDKSLLLINSGMAPLKPYFTGQKTPPHKRVATCQKCIRTPDIERVGKTDRHGTFFEMLGNFSFGDYFKDDAIKWAWEFCTEWLKLPEEKLWITIYEDDDEAFEIWNKKIGIPKEKIVRMGKEDNFWEIGLGPCGPCSEIYYDRGEEYGCGSSDCAVGCECDRYMEFWNLVFTQFDKDEEGNYNKLEHPNIDTGMGLERMASVMQGTKSIFEVDTLNYILKYICELAGVRYRDNAKTDVSIRVITDHIRSVTFMVSDGILPSNEGRGYILRRLLRRAVRHGKLLNINGSFLGKVARKVIEIGCDAYPELKEREEYILSIIDIEEKRFEETLEQGLHILENYMSQLDKEGALSGESAFKLYDTYGFPLDLTKDILEENGFSVDEAGFEKEMKLQQERARTAREDTDAEAWKEEIYSKLSKSVKATEFVGYDSYTADSIIEAIIADNNIAEKANKGMEVSIILDKTPFYAESGGQLSDIGFIKSDDYLLEVYDCKKANDILHVHKCKVLEGEVKVGDKCSAKINVQYRLSAARNHTSTHLLHKALRNALGNHVEQAGSLVSSDRLRFDFTHFKPITKEELDSIERKVNEVIWNSEEVTVTETNMENAKKMGAMALFGEKYGDEVRVIKIGDYSTELCGGTHLKNTSQIGMFKIVSEGGIAAGVRRIEAISGIKLYEHLLEKENLIKDIGTTLKVSEKDILNRIEFNTKQIKEQEREINQLKNQISGSSINDYISKVKEIGGVKYLTTEVSGLDIDGMRQLGDKLRDKVEKGVITLYSMEEERAVFLIMADKKATASGVHAGNLIKEIAKMGGGSGGGRPDMAQGGIKDSGKIEMITGKIPQIIESQIK